MVDANTIVASANINTSEIASSLLSMMLANLRESLFAALSAIASLLKPILSTFGIALTPTGYIIVATFVLAAILYSLHKMTWNVLKALLVGLLIAILLSKFGIIK